MGSETAAGRTEIDGADELMDADAVCAVFGGNKPIDPSTLYRGIKAGRYPAPVKIGPNISRWIRSRCVSARAALIAASDRAA